MNTISNSDPNSNEQANRIAPSASSPGDSLGNNEIETKTSVPAKLDEEKFVGKDELLNRFKQQLAHFENWYKNRDWLAFHHHHYDWWMFPIDEESSRHRAFQLPEDVRIDLLENHKDFINDLRRGVRLMVSSWGWDIDKGDYFAELDDKQKWSYWPVRLYKAGKCMWLFEQYDYYESLKKLANRIKYKQHEKLDFYSHAKKGKADVIAQWDEMESKRRY